MNKIEKQRRSNFLKSCILLVVTPLIFLLVDSFTSMLYWQMPSIFYPLTLFLFGLKGAIGGVFITQTLVWFRRRHRTRSVGVACLMLLGCLCIGNLIGDVREIGRPSVAVLPMLAVQIGLMLLGLIAHAFVLLAVQSVVGFDLIDLAEGHRRESPTGRINHQDDGAEQDNAEGVPSDFQNTDLLVGHDEPTARSPITIGTLMLATLASAAAFLFLKWIRTIYGEAGLDDSYPVNDVGHSVWIITSSLANVLCLVAAWHQRCTKRLLSSSLIVVSTMAISSIGIFAWLLSVPLSNFSDFGIWGVCIVMDSTFMFVLHLLLLARWERAEFRLRMKRRF